MKKDKADRARQFMPFDALDGFRALIEEQDKVVEKRKELSEERIEMLNERIRKVRKGERIIITYYNRDGYVKKDGIVSGFDFALKYIRVVDTKIYFEDMFDIEYP